MARKRPIIVLRISPVRTKDQARHARRKAEIVAAAADCFARRGVRQTTMQEICAAVSLSPGTLYRYFASKEDIITALAREEAHSIQELTQALQAAPDVVTGLREALPALVETMSSPHYGRLALAPLTALGVGLAVEAFGISPVVGALALSVALASAPAWIGGRHITSGSRP